MELGLYGKVVGISGVGSVKGIGFAIARAFLREGCKLFVCDINDGALQAVVAELRQYGDAVGYACDVSSEESVKALFSRAMDHYGRLDIWLNNAGIYPQKPLMETSAQDWDRLMGVNLRSVLLCTQAAARAMEGHPGVVINAASFAALIGSAGSAGYAASKAAVLSLTKSFAAELASRGIRVCAYIPGVIATEMTGGVIEQKGDGLLAQIAIGRLGEPDDVAKAAVFLASDAASYITGCALEVTGGKLCVQNCDYSWK